MSFIIITLCSVVICGWIVKIVTEPDITIEQQDPYQW